MKVYLQTFGCRANQYDSEQVRAVLLASGHEMVDSPTAADAAVFNSCAVTADAEADLRQSVRKAARLQPKLRTVVMGCAAATSTTALRYLPSVASVIPGGDIEAVAAALGVHSAATARVQTGTRAVLRIQDGCDEHCTFCATTMARGANRSRSIESLCDEAGMLAENHAEIVITGIHIGTYGRDTGATLGALMQALVKRVPSARFRLSSLEATEVDGALRELFAEPLHVAPYLHAPLQSGSDRVLKRMGRHWYTASTYASAIEAVVGHRAVFGLGADVIAGFPGETEADHESTLALVAQLPFTSLHVFPYSRRPGTAADRLSGHLSPDLVKRRASELRVLSARKGAEYAARRGGGEADVIVMGGAGDRQALTGDYLSVGLANQGLPRGMRFPARLVATGGTLIAHESSRSASAPAERTQGVEPTLQRAATISAQ